MNEVVILQETCKKRFEPVVKKSINYLKKKMNIF